MYFHTRRDLLAALAASPLLSRAIAQDPVEFPGVAYRDYPRCLPDYLRGLAAAAREKRNAALKEIDSTNAVRERQQWVRKTLIELIGKFPQKTDLNLRITGSFERPGYRLERVVYESRPNLHISANLYVPTSGRGPFPGVLFQLGHAGNGKAYDSYQRACQGLARLGFLVLAFDPMGQGERIYYPDASGIRTRLPEGADEEHTHPGKQMLLAGKTCTQFQLWDAIRSLDYLASHPLVDSTRLASTGQSGGGTLSMLLAAVDDRLATVAVFSGNTENVATANFLPPGSTDDAEQNFVGAGPLGFDRWDLLYPFAPKPMLISISDKDDFGTYSPNYVKDSWEEYRRLARVYAMLGEPRNLSWTDTPLPHGLSYDSRLAMYDWLSRHLQGNSTGIRQEPTMKPEPDSDLWVSPSGNLVRSMGGDTPFQVTRKTAAALARHSKPLESVLGMERAVAKPAVSLRRVPSAGGTTIEALDIASIADVHLPAWLFRPRTEIPAKPILLLLHPAGRNSAWKEGDLCHQLAAGGITVCAADVRGVGDLTPEFSSGSSGYARQHQMEEDYAWSSLILGKPLVSQRATDILAITDALRLQGREVVVAAFGQMVVPALFAGALVPEIRKLYLAGGLSSYRKIVDTENHRHTLADFVPNILSYTDLPEVVAGLAPRHVVIAGAVDATGASVGLSEARDVYADALKQGHLDLREKADWSASSLLRFCS
jgi:dienelactone hydrolase